MAFSVIANCHFRSKSRSASSRFIRRSISSAMPPERTLSPEARAPVRRLPDIRILAFSTLPAARDCCVGSEVRLQQRIPASRVGRRKAAEPPECEVEDWGLDERGGAASPPPPPAQSDQRRGASLLGPSKPCPSRASHG